jgi:hypothetical protein
MFLRPLHPRIWRAAAATLALGLAAPAFGCGAMTGQGRIAEATERGELRLDDGRALRLAGLDTPAPGSWLDRIADRWAGRDIRIAILAPAPDRWGRWLADVQATDGASLTDDLLAAGLVRVKPEFETRACEAARLVLENGARLDRLGLWAAPSAVIAATDAGALTEADGRFVVVEGRVRRIGLGRSRVYLDFGGRGGFTVIALRKAEAAFQRRGQAFSSFAGQSVRVRGVLDGRFGPRIELADPLMIERTEGIGGSGSGG